MSTNASYPFVGSTGGGGSGITQLTGYVTAGPGTGSVAATIANGVITAAMFAPGVLPRTLTAQWLTADGLSKTVTHNWGTENISIQVINNDDNFSTIETEVTRPSTNTAILAASEAPGTAWTILLSEILH